MKSWLRSLIGPKNSIILRYDPLNISVDKLEETCQEVTKYYRFSTVGEIGRSLKEKSTLGQVALAFTHARKKFFLELLPLLQEKQFPFTLYLDADCIGTNLLPQTETIALYHHHFPESTKTIDPKTLRESFGPLPLNDLDPLQFFGRWKEILNIDPNLWEPGLSLSKAPPEHWEQQHNFVRTQLQRELTSGWKDSTEPHSLPTALLTCLTSRQGHVDKECSPLELPYFGMSSGKGNT